MSLALLRTSSTARSALRVGATVSSSKAGLVGASFTRGKVTLPDLPYDYGALEPHISGKIMELHHKAHHQTYVNSYNTFSAQMQEASKAQDIPAILSLQPLLNFHGGGHINHSLFWENLSPTSAHGGQPPTGALAGALNSTYGSLSAFQDAFNKALAALQGSGWVWLVRNKDTHNIAIRSYANQDPVIGPFEPLLGIDAWEHAYYLQYQNRKAEYFKAVWQVVNWKKVEERYGKK
ncbi:MAG: hypothetical protein M1813_007838 [Trichoglossum hirsutum]|nr:MAG: hypothetical protein M1813_007838 [Trichoglossum hirsutum]